MAFDIVIRDGLVVDGSGADPRPADVGIAGDRITAVERGLPRAKREINAGGRLVTPGFVDIHTHLDAQLWWDPVGTSSCWHGVTSAVLGNCGVTFAPVKPADHRYLAEMMESVEDIPTNAIMDGLDWNWQTYGEYLAALDRRAKGINVGGLVGHCAVRYYVMGERSLDETPAAPEDIAAMCELVGEAIDSGALGFSTSRTYLHRVPDGRPVPGTYATAEEMLAFGEVLGQRRRGVFEAAARLGERDGADLAKTLAEVGWMNQLSATYQRPVTFGLTQSDRRPGLYRRVIEAVEAGRAQGANVRPQTTARGIGILYGASNRTPWDKAPAWRALRSLSTAERLAAYRDPERRAQLVAEANELFPAGDFVAKIDFATVYVMPAGDARYDLGPDDSLAAHAQRLGTTPADAFLALTLERGGELLLNFPFLNQDLGAVQEMLSNPTVVMGLADAGAHVGQIMDSSQPTFFLTYWVRERGQFSVGEAVRRLTTDTADLFGIKGRGRIAPGAYADLNVFALEELRLPQPEYVHDFPHGAGRYVQKAQGYAYTLVNGEVFMQDGQHSGALAGRVLRSTPN